LIQGGERGKKKKKKIPRGIFEKEKAGRWDEGTNTSWEEKKVVLSGGEREGARKRHRHGTARSG